MDGLIYVLIMAVPVVYFIPAYVGRKNRNANAIFLLNLFLGWTLIGWVVALVWATYKEKETTAEIQK